MADFPSELIGGYHDFRSGSYRVEQERYATLAAQGQKPSAMIIACCDSRSAPETVFNARPGEMFVVRSVANLVPPHNVDDGFHATAAALEFAVHGLKVQHIIVMGHGKCGGVAAALNPDMEPLSPDGFVGKWTALLRADAEAIAQDDTLSAEEKQTALERKSVRQSIENLRSFPFVSQFEREGKLSLHGAWFDISLGELWTLDPQSGKFSPASVEMGQ